MLRTGVEQQDDVEWLFLVRKVQDLASLAVVGDLEILFGELLDGLSLVQNLRVHADHCHQLRNVACWWKARPRRRRTLCRMSKGRGQELFHSEVRSRPQLERCILRRMSSLAVSGLFWFSVLSGFDFCGRSMVQVSERWSGHGRLMAA
jgi:hypothetical protein